MSAAKAEHFPAGTAEFSSGYANAYFVGLALKKCGYPCTGGKLATELSSLGSDSATGGIAFGPVKFSDKDHSGPQDAVFVHWDTAESGIAQLPGVYAMPS